MHALLHSWLAIVLWIAVAAAPAGHAQTVRQAQSAANPSNANALAVISVQTKTTAHDLPREEVAGAAVRNAAGEAIGEVARVTPGENPRAVITLARPVDPDIVAIEVPLDKLVFESDGAFVVNLMQDEAPYSDE